MLTVQCKCNCLNVSLVTRQPLSHDQTGNESAVFEMADPTRLGLSSELQAEPFFCNNKLRCVNAVIGEKYPYLVQQQRAPGQQHTQAARGTGNRTNNPSSGGIGSTTTTGSLSTTSNSGQLVAVESPGAGGDTGHHNSNNNQTWVIYKCLLCDVLVFATAKPKRLFEPVLCLVPEQFITNSSVIDKLVSSEDFSIVYGLVVPKKETLPPHINTKHGFQSSTASHRATTTIKTDAAMSYSNKIQSMSSDFLAAEYSAMEARIKKYSDEQHSAYRKLEKEVKAQRQVMLSVPAKLSSDQVSSDEDIDSAVPLSPFSQTSGNPSPAFASDAGSHSNRDFDALRGSNSKTDVGELHEEDLYEPKPLTPAPVNPERKRHSGGSGNIRSLTPLEDSTDEIFAFEDEDPPLDYNSGDDADTDDSGLADDFNHSVEPVVVQANHNATGVVWPQQQQQVTVVKPMALPNTTIAPSHRAGMMMPVVVRPKAGSQAFGQSLPTMAWAIPSGGRSIKPMRDLDEDDDQDMGDEDGGLDQNMQRMAESIQKLGRSLYPADAPEMLFGDRPNRRRFQ